MYPLLRSALLIAVGVTVAIGTTTLPGRAGDKSKDLQARIDKLEKQVGKLQAKLKYVSVVDDPINGLAGPHVIFEGCNVHVRDGSGRTFNWDKDRALDGSAKALPPPQKLGNLIIGYNEVPFTSEPARGGSHNLVVGSGHNYPTVGCVVFGEENTVSGLSSTVTGGLLNQAINDASSVSGGRLNIASNACSSVSGGAENTASGNFSSVSGGRLNRALANYSSVGGGNTNTSEGSNSYVAGGIFNVASGPYSSATGGNTNYASGDYASVCGGGFGYAAGNFASVSGGYINTAFGEYSSVGGGRENEADGNSSSISGGYQRRAPGADDWAAGSLAEDF